jgi:NAD+ synthase (glutamine-hydrolysing)
MIHHGFLRVAAAAPPLRATDCSANAEQVLTLMRQAQGEAVAVLVFPELALTGGPCAELLERAVLQGARDALERLVGASASEFAGLLCVGLPLAIDDLVFDCAAVLYRGSILGVVPRSFLPDDEEVSARRRLAPASSARGREVNLFGKPVPFGAELLFTAPDADGLTVGVEVGDDLAAPVPPGSLQAVSGATLLVNLSASNGIVGKNASRRRLVVNQSGRCIAGCVCSSIGGHCLIAENGVLLAESTGSDRKPGLLVSDIDLDRLRVDRIRTNSFGETALSAVHREFRRAPFALGSAAPPARLHRPVEARPFVPVGQELNGRCREIFSTQVAGLARRLEHIGKPAVSIGVSGGLDSTLALLVACKTFDALAAPRDRILALTMPGFGTTSRTRGNAMALMRQLGVTAREVDIREMCLAEWRALNYRPFGIDLDGLGVEELTERLRKLSPEARHDLVFENVQARMRTTLLMNTGFVIGTGDVSELALGFCTYNADHMSMYNPNTSIPKTLVKFLVEWAAHNEFEADARLTLLDVVGTLISPELLPADPDGKVVHSSEGVIGPYELHDFFLFHFLRYGASPEKILFLANQATFSKPFSPPEIRRWLILFIQRFFANQYKRSCLPDGPKVGSVSLSPRGDWRMPSDASAALWLAWADSA